MSDRNALRLPDMEAPPLQEVVETVSYDDVMRVERLACGHTKTTLTAQDRPARRRRCLKCVRQLDLETMRKEVS